MDPAGEDEEGMATRDEEGDIGKLDRIRLGQKWSEGMC